MKTVRLVYTAVLTTAIIAATAIAQPPGPGPEHAMLKKKEGTWDATMKMGDTQEKGTAVYKMTMGDLWLESKFDIMMMGQKFTGRGFDGYDPIKKKFVAVWLDSTSTLPMVMEGTYDQATKTTTMSGEARDMEGKMAKYKMVTKMSDDNTMSFAMYVGDAKEPMMTIQYKRKK